MPSEVVASKAVAVVVAVVAAAVGRTRSHGSLFWLVASCFWQRAKSE